MSIKINSDVGYTSASIDFYERYKEAFGNVVSAEMIANPEKVEFKLILINEDEEELVFEGGLTSGYSGEGPSGTERILKLAGFEVSDDFTEDNVLFKLTK